MKKKKYVQNEKERLHQEEAARKRAEKAVAVKKDKRKSAIVMIAVAAGFLAVSCVLLGLNVAKMRNYEINYVRTYGTIVDFKLHRTGRDRVYTAVFSYTYDGETYRAEDWESYRAREESLIGKTVEIYVNPKNPQSAGRVKTADGFSVMSVGAFAVALLVYAGGMASLLAVDNITFKRRTAFIWLPIAALSVCYILLLRLSLPNDGFLAVFGRVRGAWGAVVAICAAAFAFVLDFILSHGRRSGKRK